MKYKKGLIVICLIICLFMIASVSAVDGNATSDDIVSPDESNGANSDDAIASDKSDDSDIMGLSNENDVLNDFHSFTELQTLIDNADETGITLNDSYSRGDGENTITIKKSITINGNDNTINAYNQGRIFSIENDAITVVLKNIKFYNGQSAENGGAILNTRPSSYLTLYDFYNLQPQNTYKISYLDDISIRDNEVASIITLLEWIYNPGTGSVIEYKEGEAIRKAKDRETKIVKEYIKPMQEGMLEGAKIINEYMKYHPYQAEESKKFVYKLIRKIKTKPSKELVDAYYSMVFNDTFGTAEYVEKDDKLSTKDRLNIFRCRNLLRKELWKEAFIIHNDIEYMNALTGVKGGLRRILGKG